MTWIKSLETGVDAIDIQHKQLFDKADELLAAGKSQQDSQKINEMMQFLEVYIVKHFQDEEALHRSSQYPKAALHKTFHDNYIHDFKRLKERYITEGESLNVVIAINKSVVDWLMNHINVHDREFSKFYMNKN